MSLTNYLRATSSLSSIHMSLLRDAAASGVTVDDLADPDMSTDKIKFIIIARKYKMNSVAKAFKALPNDNFISQFQKACSSDGLNIYQYYENLFSNTKLTQKQIISIIKRPKYTIDQKYDILDGMNDGIDTSIYMNPRIPTGCMARIAESLKEGFFHPILVDYALDKHNIFYHSGTYGVLKFCKKIGRLDAVLNWLDTYKDDVTPLRLDAIGLWLYQEKMGREHSIDFESLLDMNISDNDLHTAAGITNEYVKIDLRPYINNLPFQIDALIALLDNNYRSKVQKIKCRIYIPVSTAKTYVDKRPDAADTIIDLLTDSNVPRRLINRYICNSHINAHATETVGRLLHHGSTYPYIKYMMKYIQPIESESRATQHEQIATYHLINDAARIQQNGASVNDIKIAISCIQDPKFPAKYVDLITCLLQHPYYHRFFRLAVKCCKINVSDAKKHTLIMAAINGYDLTRYVNHGPSCLDYILFCRFHNINVDTKMSDVQIKKWVINKIQKDCGCAVTPELIKEQYSIDHSRLETHKLVINTYIISEHHSNVSDLLHLKVDS